MSVTRRLAAILAADMAGYSHLMEVDEQGTIARQRVHRQELIDPTIALHGGRIVKTTGDGLLIEFASAVNAVQCAVEIQRAMAKREADVDLDRRIRYRVGVNVGDIVVEGDDILGSGVNVAARLEALADPGGILLSGSVFDQVDGKLDVSFEDLGEKTIKNIQRLVRIYRVRLDHDDAAAVGATDTRSSTLRASDRPSVAVLPFDNMSGDPGQDYFSDGLTEDIITALALVRSFPVVARNSTFAYKGKSPDVRSLASQLGARYVLEGSVRRSGEQVRITAQLIDTATGAHVWAERFDRRLTDIFALQDEIVQRITATVVPEMERAEQKRSLAKKPQSLDAWEYVQRGMACLYRFSKAGNAEAREMFQRAIERDPDYSQAYSGLAQSYHRDLRMEVADDRAASIAKCLEAARRGVELDPLNAHARVVLALAHVWPDEHDLAIAEAEKALELNPNDAEAHCALGNMLDAIGQSDAGIGEIETGLRLNPLDPRNHNYLTILARAHLNARRYDDALRWARKALQNRPTYPNASYILAAALGHLGRQAEARVALEDCERASPGFVANRQSWKPYKNAADNLHILAGIRKAQLTD